MKKRRSIWGGLLVILTVNLVFSNSAAGMYLFLGALLVPLMGIALTAVCIKDLDVRLQLQKTCGKGQTVEGSMQIQNKSMVPVLRGEVKVTSYNRLTMEKEKVTVVSGFSKAPKTLNFSFESRHCGGIEIKAEQVDVFDPFGLWRKSLQPFAASAITVLPDTFDLHLQLAHGNLPNQDSVEYAQGRTGSDLSEIFAIREYQEGDSIRNIHWKLSGKYEELMVKLASMPLENSMLLLLETDLLEEGEVQPDAFDALAEIYMTVSQHLIDNEISHKAGWYDHEIQRMFLFDVNEEADLHGMMTKSLSAKRTVAGSNVIDRCLEELGQIEQAHVVCVTHRDSGCMEKLPEELIKTTIVCSQQGEAALGPYDYTCTPEDYQVQLQSMII